MAKHVLHSGGDEFDFVVIGITSPDDQYRATSLVNDVLGIDLKLSDYVPFNLKSGKFFSFSLYRHIDETLALEYCFIPNASNFEQPGTGGAPAGDLFSGQEIDESTRLIRELPKTDYFLLVKGEAKEHHQFTVLQLLRDCGAFTQVQVIDPLSLSSRSNLLF